jgi:hypothetical protein
LKYLIQRFLALPLVEPRLHLPRPGAPQQLFHGKPRLPLERFG